MLKRFDFFTRTLVTSDGIALDARGLGPAQQGHEAFQSDDFTCCAGGGGRFALGDSRGGVTLMGSIALKPKRFVLTENEAISLMNITGDVLTIATTTSQVLLFKLWASAGIGPGEPPRLSHKLNAIIVTAWRKRGLPPSSPTCMTLSKDFKHLALGFRDGFILWLRSRDIRLDTGQDESYDWVVSQSSMSNPCTCLGFASEGRGLWVAYEKKIVFFTEERREVELDTDEGCYRDCGAVAPDSNFFVTGKKDRVVFYNSETAGSLYSIMGEREKLVTCRQNIVLVSSGETWRGLGRGEQQPPDASSLAKQTIQVLDLTNKLMAHEFSLWRDGMDKCAFIAGDDESRCVFVLTKNKKRLWRLQEKSDDAKLDDLLKRNLYSTAAALARSAGLEFAYISDIYRKYGDHLYEKGSYDDAIVQYIQTLGQLEPSYVIRKFLDAPRVKNLASYLEALHGVGQYHRPELQDLALPTAEHTTLLLTCYAKLKEEDKIRYLLNSPDAKIDVDAALSVLKETGRFVPALELAKSRGKDTWYVQTLLEMADKRTDHHARAALEFIHDKVSVFLFRSHAAKLLELLPAESLQCVRDWVVVRRVVKVEDIMDCFIDLPDALESLCLDAILRDDDSMGNPPSVVYNTCLALCLSRDHLDKAMEVMSHPRSNIDDNLALALVKKFKFRQGELFLHEKSQRWDLLLRCKMEDGDKGVLSLAKAKLTTDSDSWLAILRWLSLRPVSPDRNSSIRDALAHIEQQDVLPPLLALRVLSEGPNVPLGVVRPYLVSQIQRATRQAESDRAEVSQLREDTERMRLEAKSLASEPKVFNATSCCMTGAPLELPVVHFMSGNSYNLSSLPLAHSASLDRLEDPKCANDQNTVLEISRGLAKRRMDVDEEFFSELQMSQGGESGFALVADYFGKCLFEDDD